MAEHFGERAPLAAVDEQAAQVAQGGAVGGLDREQAAQGGDGGGGIGEAVVLHGGEAPEQVDADGGVDDHIGRAAQRFGGFGPAAGGEQGFGELAVGVGAARVVGDRGGEERRDAVGGLGVQGGDLGEAGAAGGAAGGVFDLGAEAIGDVEVGAGVAVAAVQIGEADERDRVVGVVVEHPVDQAAGGVELA